MGARMAVLLGFVRQLCIGFFSTSVLMEEGCNCMPNFLFHSLVRRLLRYAILVGAAGNEQSHLASGVRPLAFCNCFWGIRL